MPADTYGARPIITVNGVQLAPGLETRVRHVVVESDAQGPDGCRIVLDDPAREALGEGGFDFQATLTVKAARTGEQAEQDLFAGHIYSLGVDYDERGALATIGAFDNSYGLYSGLHTTTYRDVSDSDLATRLAREAGLSPGRIESTSVIHEHVSQVNESHWDFLRRRAAEIDYEVRVVGDKLHFTPSTSADEGPEPGDYRSTDRLQLTPGGNLEHFSARITAAQQVTEVEVRGWDPQNKREIVATAPARSRAASLAEDADELAAGNGSPRHVTTWLPLSTQAEVDAAVASEAERLAGTCVHAEGIARGDPRILAGTAVSVGQTGGRFDGKLTVTHARHVFGPTGYRTHFTVSGRHDRSMRGLVTGEGGRGGGRRSLPGVVLGIVTNVADPEQRGRVKVSFPWLSGEYESHWARVVQPGAGPERGLLVLPEVNDEVLVAFEHGDARRPYVLGGLFNGADLPPFEGGVDAGNGSVKVRGLRTRRGHELIFSDADGEERIELRTSDGKVAVVLDHTGGNVTVDADTDVIVNARGNATVTAQRDLRLEAKGTGTFKADRGLTLESGMGEVKVKGTFIRLN